MQHEAITRQILEAAFDVANELGPGFLESVYENAMLIRLREMPMRVEPQQPLVVHFRGQPVGTFYADIMVDDLVILELKAAKEIIPEHQAQVLNYLKATGKPVGLLLNFGATKLQYRRFDNRFGP